MRTALICIAAVGGFAVASAAVAEAPPAPRGNFGGGALVPPPRDIFGAGNAIVAVRALPKRRLEIEATLRARCAGGEFVTDAKLAANGRFRVKGTATQQPDPVSKITTRYTLSGRFTEANAAEGTVSARIERSVEGRKTTCRTGTVKFGVRRPVSGVGKAGAPNAARYYGTTTQRGVNANRAIVMRVSSDGRRLTRALFGESVKCSDDRVSIGIEAPRTNVRIDSRGRVRDRERFTITKGETITKVDDRFTGQFGRKGARGTFSLSDRTTDRASGRTIQTCKSGTIRWRASR